MTKQTPAPVPTAAEQGRRFYADPTMRLAAQAARTNQDWTRVAQASAAGSRVPARSPRATVAGTAQARAVRSGRPVRALPTKRARTIKRRVRRTERRLIGAGAVLGIVLLTLVFLIPLAAAVGVSLATAAMFLAYSK
jgi:hypothetical protein